MNTDHIAGFAEHLADLFAPPLVPEDERSLGDEAGQALSRNEHNARALEWRGRMTTNIAATIQSLIEDAEAEQHLRTQRECAAAIIEMAASHKNTLEQAITHACKRDALPAADILTDLKDLVDDWRLS
jgi:hypothetical protein